MTTSYLLTAGVGRIAKIIGEAGIEITPQTEGFASELRSDVSRDLAAATAGQDRTVHIRVTTDVDRAEAQIRAGLAKLQQNISQIFDRTRTRAQALYQFLEQRVVIRLANKVREWTQKSIVRVKALMEPFWKFMRERLAQVQRGWQAFRQIAERGADAVAQKWRQAMAVVSAQLSRVRQVGRNAMTAVSQAVERVADAGRRAFAQLAEAAEPHLARIRRGVERLQFPFKVVGAYAQASFRIIGDAGQRAAARVSDAFGRATTRVSDGASRMGTAVSSAFTRATRPLRDFRSGMRDVMSALDEGATKSTKFGALTRLAMVRAAQGIITAAVRFGDFSERVTKGEGLIRAAGQKIGSSFRFLGQVLTDTNRAGIRFGDGMKRAGDRVSGTSRVSRVFGGVLRGVGSVFSAVGSAGTALSGVFGKLEDGLVGLGGKGAELLQTIPQLVMQFAKFAVIGGAVTYVIGAVAAAVVALPALVLGAAAAFGVMALGMDGIKKAYNNGLKPALDQLKKQISDVFEAKLTPAFQKLSTQLLPQITDKLKTLATSVANVGVHLVDLVTKGENVAKLNKVIDTMAQIISSQVDPALQKLIQSFIDLGSNAQILNAIGGMFTDLIGKTADWLAEMNRTGEATRAVESLRSVLGHLEDLFFRVATAAAKFFSDATPGVSKLVDSAGRLVDMVGRLGGAFGDAAGAAADLINSIPQGTLDAIVSAIDRLGQKLKEAGQDRGLQQLLADLGDQLPGIIDGFTQFLDAITSVADGIEQLQYGVAKADQFLENLGVGFTTESEKALIAAHENQKAGDQIGDGIKDGVDKGKESLGTLPPAASDAGQGVLDGVKPPVGQIPGVVDTATGQVSFQPVLDAANQVFGQLPTTVADGVNKSVDSMTQGSDKIKASAETGFNGAATAATTNMVTIGDVVEERMQAAAQSAEVGGTRIGDAIRNGVQGAADAAQAGMGRVSEAVRTAMDAAADAASSGGDRIRSAVENACNGAADVAQAGMARVSEAVRTGMDQAAQAAQDGGQRIVDGLRSSVDGAAAAVEAGMSKVSTAVEQGMQRAVQASTQGGQQIRQIFTQTFQQVVQVTTQAWQRIVQAFEQGGQRAVASARNTGSQVVSTFQSYAGPMYSAGYTLIQRLTDGMIAAGAQATAAAARIAASIKAQFPSSPAKEGPLSGAGDPLRSGGTIVARLAAGMVANAAAVTAALQPILAGMVARVNSVAANPMVDAAKEILARIQAKGQMYEDLTWKGASPNVGRYNDDLLNAQDRSGIRDTRAFLEDYIRRNTPATTTVGGSGDVAGLLAQILGVLIGMRGDAAGQGYGPDMLARLDDLIAAVSGRSGTAASRAAGARDLSELGAFP